MISLALASQDPLGKKSTVLSSESWQLFKRLVVATALAVPSCGQAQSNARSGWSADVIQIAPWGYRDGRGQLQGVYNLTLKEMAKRSGCPLQTQLKPIKRSIQDISNNISQLTIMLDRKELNEAAVPLGIVALLSIEIWSRPGSKILSLADLKGKTVAVLRGPAYHEAFDASTDITKYEVSGPTQQLEMLRSGRVDAAIGVRENFIVALQEMGLTPSSMDPPLRLGHRQAVAYVSKSVLQTDCANQLRASLNEMRESGLIDKFISQAIAR